MNAATLLAGLRRADYRHDGGIRCLRLFDLEPAFFSALRDDVDRLCRAEQGSDVSDPAHVTNWTRPSGTVRQLSLLSASGRFDDYQSDHDLSCLGKSFNHAPQYPALAALLAACPHAINFRINILGAGAALGAHEENVVFRTRSGSIGARVRFHLPVRTNPAAVITLDDHVYALAAGSVYLVNQGCVHSVRNPGPAARTHLVWDALLTPVTFACMFGGEPLAPGLIVAPDEDRAVLQLGFETTTEHVRRPPLVPPADAVNLTLCEVQ